MGQHEVGGTRGEALAVVASPSAQERSEMQRVLGSHGHRSTTVATAPDVLNEVLVTRPDILLVDLDLALAYAGSLAEVVGEHPELSGLPVIVLLPEGGVDALPATLAPYVSDVVFRPVDPVELLHRTRAMISRRRRHEEQRALSSQLREDMRSISARIRATNDPAVMIDQFLPGIGRALGARHLALQIFDDERVGVGSSSWTSGPGATRSSPATPEPEHQDAALTLALRLWEDATTVPFHTGPAGAGGVAVPPWLRDGLGDDRTASGFVAALGEGDTPFGLLWVVNDTAPSARSGLEGALTQHVLGNLAHGLIQAQLISRQQQAVRKLRALNQAKTDFVGTVNHELRTPLASISGYLEMLIDGAGGELPPEASTMLQAVERNAVKLSQLIEDISALSAQQTDASEHGPVDIVHLVSHLTDRLALQASTGGIHLACSLPDHPVTVSGDRDELSAAIVILLSNALKFTHADGSVFVDLMVEPDNGQMVLVIRDTGIGIPAEDLPRLFDSFHRASNAQQSLPGAGVGLSIAKKTFEAHHGTISIDSTLGVGTSVGVTLPLLDHAAVG
ncbi:hybrid sensor histidine kinase/response regulator [Arthrobacter sp. B1805]|uniref:ATP-binding response regulator n=1 Tax=Arthrobacter sp. B1805 TaxID=2058892 RepID=UPI0015E35047|nr:hybrid sensor histidine kinase/response regulator [Arthrobacter sp. B1805]